MMAGFASWWRLRSEREQRLLIVMFVLLGIVLAWLLVIRPLGDTLEAAKRRHAEAVTALAEAKARTQTARPTRGVRSQPPSGPLDRFISRTATEAGFAGARVAGRGGGQVTIAIDAARPQAFFAWVRQMEEQGLVVDSLRARANQDRTLAVEAAFRERRR